MSSDDKKAPTGAGVFVTRGMRVAIPPGGLVLTVRPDGTLSGSVNAVHVALNMCPRWIAIAYAHLLATQEAHTDLLAAFQSGDERALGLALEREADAGMQAVLSSCTAMDAYYGLLRKQTLIDDETHEQWQRNRTARHVRIAEVLRRTFEMKPEGFEIVRAILKQGFGLRDKAVHPTAELANPMAYDEIERATEWRLVCFRFENAKAVTGQFLSVLMATSAQPARKPTPDLTDLLSSTNRLCAPILAEWEARFGTLVRTGSAGSKPEIT
jgi:hypothetical protein